MENLDQQFNAPRQQKDNLLYPRNNFCSTTFEDNDIIDVSGLSFFDDESWLVSCSSKSEKDLRKWLYCFIDSPEELFTNNSPQVQTEQKIYDSRTFTRPKKGLTRPSIEKYNQELYGSNPSLPSPQKLTDSGIHLNGFSDDNETVSAQPLHFDLSLPSTSHYFESIANTAAIDSFQNMSPPSLVNSMCSSTFANLMESSFIKNDPVLREIRDTDFTETVLQQETEPLFQSMTESFSSLNSDVPENFLKKVSFNSDTFKKSFIKGENVENKSMASDLNVLNMTYDKDEFLNEKDADVIFTHDNQKVINNEDEDVTITPENLNGTYQRKPRTQTTFRLADLQNGTIKLNGTFQRLKLNRTSTVESNSSPPPRTDLNATITLSPENVKMRESLGGSFENVKRLLDRRPSPSFDLNKLNHQAENEKEQLETTFLVNKSKRDSLGSNESTENLDYMSVSSGSSRSSNKILSMDGINAIVEMQEKSLQQIMSTPQSNTYNKIMWENNIISPISGRSSDPELSSIEKAEATHVINSNTIKKQKSLVNIAPKESTHRYITTKLQNTNSNIKGSLPSLKGTEMRPRGSYTNLHRPTQGSRTNLNSMGHTLKGSYTSLKPTNTNLPVAPPLDTTMTMPKKVNVTHIVEGKIAQVSPIPRGPSNNQDAQFVKPQPPKLSGLPRPVTAATGIPRPVSRIPGPRSVRPVVKSAGQPRR